MKRVRRHAACCAARRARGPPAARRALSASQLTGRARAASAAAIRLLLRDEPRLAAERATLAARRSQFRGFARADLPAGPGAAAGGEGGVSPRLRRAVRLLLLRGRWRQAGRRKGSEGGVSGLARGAKRRACAASRHQ